MWMIKFAKYWKLDGKICKKKKKNLSGNAHKNMKVGC